MKMMNNRIEKLAKIIFRARKHRGHKNLIESKHSGFFQTKFSFKGKQNKIIVTNSIFYKCKFHFFGSNNIIRIGTNCTFKNVDFWIEGDNNLISIGESCSFCGSAQIACLEGTKIVIGNNILCSSDVFLRTSDSHSIIDIDGKRINLAKDIEVCNNVWLCQKVTLLKGVKIPNNCVVAYGSVVTKPFNEEHCAIGGNPAKIIKKKINWKPER